jgi:NADPH-dependent glutamate synthase beta subunit-like oxidoreductase/CO/xanthine dehydrogenase FAD-binding subunit
MKNFNHIRAATYDEASIALREAGGTAQVMAGGSDLVNIFRDRILPDYPETVISIKNIPGSDRVEDKDGVITIGAGAKLGRLEKNPVLQEKCQALAEAAHSVASPLIRNIGTIGGNICQDVRCWYYRFPNTIGGSLYCLRKGGDTCFALNSENRYHSIFGGMHPHASPCSKECPAHTDIPRYMEQLRKGDTEGAARTIMEVNPMPMITSRVCAHFCQEKCNRCQFDENVAVGSVERFVGDYILEHSTKFYVKPSVSTGRNVAIVGSGPSGLSAAYFLARAGNAVTVYDQKEEAGGMLMYAIPAYRLPKDIVRKFTAALKGMGIQFELGKNAGKDLAPSELEKKFDSVYYATGAWKRPVLGLAGEELTVFGLDFLMEVNKWMEGKVGADVLVTGGGNVAMDVAITAKRLGAKNVVMACLESLEEMPASTEEVARAKEEGIVIMNSWGLSKVLEKDGKVRGMELKRCVSVRNEQGAFSPRYDESEKFEVKAENILMAVGQAVDLSFLSEKYRLELTKRGLIDVSEKTQMTSRDGVFAGGDATTGPATVIKAIATGHNAANGMNRFLGVSEPCVCHDAAFSTFDREGIEKAAAFKLKERPLGDRALDKEDSFSPEASEALSEAGRCMDCACYSVNASDIATVLVMLDAEIVTTSRVIPAAEFLTTKLNVRDNLAEGELVTEIRIPRVKGVTRYDKHRVRDAIDFATAALASRFDVTNGVIRDVRLVLGGVAPVPYRIAQVEDFIKGKKIDEALAEKAADLALQGASVMGKNEYKAPVVKALIKEGILRNT